MKNWQEVSARLRLELEQWFIKQCRNEYADYYLYYRPTSPITDGGFLICSEKPEGYLLGWNQPIDKGATVDQNHRKLSDVLRKLPIMNYTQ